MGEIITPVCILYVNFLVFTSLKYCLVVFSEIMISDATLILPCPSHVPVFPDEQELLVADLAVVVDVHVEHALPGLVVVVSHGCGAAQQIKNLV